jgi:hypothetical protein
VVNANGGSSYFFGPTTAVICKILPPLQMATLFSLKFWDTIASGTGLCILETLGYHLLGVEFQNS